MDETEDSINLGDVLGDNTSATTDEDNLDESLNESDDLYSKMVDKGILDPNDKKAKDNNPLSPENWLGTEKDRGRAIQKKVNKEMPVARVPHNNPSAGSNDGSLYNKLKQNGCLESLNESATILFDPENPDEFISQYGNTFITANDVIYDDTFNVGMDGLDDPFAGCNLVLKGDKYIIPKGAKCEINPNGVNGLTEISVNGGEPLDLAGDSFEVLVGDTLSESLESATIETDSDTIQVNKEGDSFSINTSEKTASTEGETISPVSPEVQSEIEANSEEPVEDISDDEYADMDIDDVDEDSFDGVTESYLKEAYNNVKAYKTSSVREKDNKLFVEGVITFNSGNQKATKFIYEGLSTDGKGKIRLSGINENISKDKAFTVNATLKDKRLVTESLSYRYEAKSSSGKNKLIEGYIKR